jgi:hypothetical protein
MDTKRIVIGTLVGAVTLHVMGFLIFGLALVDFGMANRGPATDAFKEPQLRWAFALGDLALATLVTLAIVIRGVPTIAGGVVTGAVVGCLVWFGVSFIQYGYLNVWNLTATIVGPLCSTIQYGIAGAVIAAVLARVPRSAAMRPAE